MRQAGGRARSFIRQPEKTAGGFTLIEIVAVLVLIGVLAAFAVAGSGSLPNDSQEHADLQALRGIIAYTRARAMSDTTDWVVDITPTQATSHRQGAGGGYTVTFQSGNVPAGNVTFNSRGQASGSALIYSVGSAGTLTVNSATGHIS